MDNQPTNTGSIATYAAGNKNTATPKALVEVPAMVRANDQLDDNLSSVEDRIIILFNKLNGFLTPNDPSQKSDTADRPPMSDAAHSQYNRADRLGIIKHQIDELVYRLEV